MVVNMLKAVSKMLEHTDKMPALQFQARVECAEIMLSEIIKGLEGKQIPNVGLRLPPQDVTTKLTPEIPPTKVEVPPKEEPQYMISVDEKKQLKLIKNLPLDTEVILDGKRMTHRNAIGMKFQKIKVLI